MERDQSHRRNHRPSSRISRRVPLRLKRTAAGLLVAATITAGAVASAAPGQAAAETAAELYLRALAAHLQPAATDRLTAGPAMGSYRLVEMAVWHRQGDPNDESGAIVGEHVRRWIAADRSGRVITEQTRRPPGFDMTRVDETTARETPAERVTVADYPPHTMPPTDGIDEQLLKVQAWHQSRPSAGCATDCVPFGSYELVDAMAGLHTMDLLNVRERAVALRILAAVPGLRYGGTVTDAAGRTGVMVGLDTEGWRRLVLILDRRTGELLAYQRWIHGHGLHTHVLWLRRAYTDQRGDAHGPNVTRIPISPNARL